MSEAIEYMQAMGDIRKARREAFGVACPQCKVARPKAHPSILLPQQRCKVDGYRDPRPHTSYEEELATFIKMGVCVAPEQEPQA